MQLSSYQYSNILQLTMQIGMSLLINKRQWMYNVETRVVLKFYKATYSLNHNYYILQLLHTLNSSTQKLNQGRNAIHINEYHLKSLLKGYSHTKYTRIWSYVHTLVYIVFMPIKTRFYAIDVFIPKGKILCQAWQAFTSLPLMQNTL